MLEGLDDIQWGKLHHAYGTAEDVPDKIRALLSGDEEERRWAQGMLHMGVLHQGSICSSTVHVIPFLIRLVENQATPDRIWILDFLSSATFSAYGRERFLRSQSDRETQQEAELYRIPKEDYEQQIAKELVILNDARGEILKGYPIYKRFLQHEDPDLQIVAVRLLVECQDEQDDARKALISTLHTAHDNAVQTSILFGLATRMPDDTLKKLTLELAQSPEEDSQLRLTALFALSFSSSQTIPSDMFELATQLFIETSCDNIMTVAREFHTYTQYLFHGTARVFWHYLYDVPTHTHDKLIPDLIDLFQHFNSWWSPMLDIMLWFSFGNHVLAPGDTQEQLTPTERSVLQAMADNASLWRYGEIPETSLNRAGIVCGRKREHLQAFLNGQRPASPTSNEV